MKTNRVLLVLFFILFVAAGMLVQSRSGPFHERLISTNDTTRNLAYYFLRRKSDRKRTDLVGPLSLYLTDTDPDKRRYALYALRLIGLSGPDEWEKFIALFEDPDERVRLEAFHSLMNHIPDTIPYVMEAIPSFNDELRTAIAKNIATRGKAIVPGVLPYLESPDASVRQTCASILYHAGEDGHSALPSLRGLLKDPDAGVRSMAALAISHHDPVNDALLPVFRESLSAPEWTWVQYETLHRLSLFGKKGKPLAPLLSTVIETRKDGFGDGPYPLPEAARTLSAIDPRSTDQSGLRWDLRQKNFVTRYRAVWEISRVEKPDRGLTSDLVRCLESPADPVSARAITSLGKIGLLNAERFEKNIVSFLLASFEKGGEPKRVENYYSMAGSVWAQLEHKALPPLIDRIQRDRIDVLTAHAILKELKPAFLEPLKAYLDYKDPRLRMLAALHLARAGFSSEQVKAIIERDRDAVPEAVRQEMAAALNPSDD